MFFINNKKMFQFSVFFLLPSGFTTLTLQRGRPQGAGNVEPFGHSVRRAWRPAASLRRPRADPAAARALPQARPRALHSQTLAVGAAPGEAPPLTRCLRKLTKYCLCSPVLNSGRIHVFARSALGLHAERNRIAARRPSAARRRRQRAQRQPRRRRRPALGSRSLGFTPASKDEDHRS